MKNSKDLQDEQIRTCDPKDSKECLSEDYSNLGIDVVPSSRNQKLS